MIPTSSNSPQSWHPIFSPYIFWNLIICWPRQRQTTKSKRPSLHSLITLLKRSHEFAWIGERSWDFVDHTPGQDLEWSSLPPSKPYKLMQPPPYSFIALLTIFQDKIQSTSLLSRIDRINNLIVPCCLTWKAASNQSTLAMGDRFLLFIQTLKNA